MSPVRVFRLLSGEIAAGAGAVGSILLTCRQTKTHRRGGFGAKRSHRDQHRSRSHQPFGGCGGPHPQAASLTQDAIISKLRSVRSMRGATVTSAARATEVPDVEIEFNVDRTRPPSKACQFARARSNPPTSADRSSGGIVLCDPEGVRSRHRARTREVRLGDRDRPLSHGASTMTFAKSHHQEAGQERFVACADGIHFPHADPHPDPTPLQ